MAPKYEIGQQLWCANWDSSDNWVTCPDCGGTGRLRVTFHDESTVSIECRNCAAGYDPPTGRVRVYDRKSRADLVTVNGMEILTSGVRYHVGSDNCYRIYDEPELFRSREDAMAAAVQKCAEADQADRDNVFKKEKDARTWAWNASYHRRGIKEAQRQLEYHTAKLNVAAIKAKEKAA